MKEFYSTHKIPPHLQNLLGGLAGVTTLEDLLELNEEMLASLEKQLRDGDFNSQADFSSRQTREKYLGNGDACLETFTFRPFDRIKLLRLADLAGKEISKRAESAELK